MKKHKVKLVDVCGDVILLRIDGELCSYLIQRPQPLSFVDSTMLRSMRDASTLEALARVHVAMARPHERLLQWFFGLWRHRVDVPFSLPSNGERIADYIEKVGIKLDIDESVKGVVLLETDVEKIREGRLKND